MQTQERRPARIAVQFLILGLAILLSLQIFLHLPSNWLLAIVFLWLSFKTLILFVALRPDGSSAPGGRMLTLREIGLLILANLGLLPVTAGLAVLSDRSLGAGAMVAAVLYILGYVA